jgi:hypothetical protein
MIAEFETPLKAMLKPENRRYPDVRECWTPPTNDQLVLQLEGLWPGLEKLPEYRKRGIHQLVSRIRRFKAHDSRWSFLTLGATLPPDDDTVSDETIVLNERKPVGELQYKAAKLHFDEASVALIEEAASRHAYTATVCIALINKAKATSGILPSSDFLWTREKDLHFWQLINGYGRLRHKPEVVGAFAHYGLECHQNKPVDVPQFEHAQFEELF